MKYIIGFAFSLLACSQVWSQTAWKLEGNVKDLINSQPIESATILVQGTGKGTLSDKDGRFALSNLPSRYIRLIVSRLGYSSDTLDLDVASVGRGRLEITLRESDVTLEEITIQGKMLGQRLALSRQKNSETIKNIVDIEQIEQFPDLNAAESIQRIPGITLQRDQGEGRYVQLRGTPPQLSNFNVNGEQIPSPEGDIRYVGLDVVPVDQLQSIEITKALTPDMDGDAVGGTVNLVTRTADDSIPDINAVMTGGYNNLAQKSLFQTQFSFGQRYKKFGAYLNGSYIRDPRSTHNMEFRFNKSRFAGDTSFQIHYDDVQLRHYEIVRERIGLSASLDYRFNERSEIYLRAMFNEFSDDEVRRRVRYNIGNGFLTSAASSREAEIERDVRDREKIQTISSFNAGGKHRLGPKAEIDYGASYAIAKEEIPNRVDINFTNDLVNLRLDLSEPNWPRINFPRARDSATVFNYRDYSFDEMLLLNGLTTDKNLSTRLNLKVQLSPYTFIKFGGRTRSKNKDRDNVGRVYHRYYTLFAVNNSRDSGRQVYNLVGPELNLATLMDGFEEKNLLNRDYDMGRFPGPEEVKKFTEFYYQNFKLEENDTKEESHSEDYTAEEDIYAAYAMLQREKGPWMFLGGLRYETTRINYLGYDVQFRPFSDAFDRIDTLRTQRDYSFLLPQFHIRYRPQPDLNIRLAATYTYSRPNFEDILPYRQVEYDIREITQGNPDLNFASSLNLDLLAEKYLSYQGLISGGIFYKKIQNFVYYLERRIRLEDISRPNWYFVTTAENGEDAWVMGGEATLNKQFHFLPGFWSNFGLYCNYTYTRSKAYISNRTEVREEISLPGQAPHSLNLALFYQSARAYAKISANFQSAFLDELGIDKEWDIYYDKNLHLDFNAYYNLSPQIKVFVNAVNLTNTPLKYYMGREDRVARQEFYSWIVRGGFKFDL